MDAVEILNDRKKQIFELAKTLDNTIRYDRVVDILRDKEESITEETIQKVIKELEQNGVILVRDADEEYESGNTNMDDVIPADVNISQRPMNVYNLMERLENGEIDLSPEFQRNSNLWSMEQQSRLIESLMLKIPIPTFYFNATDDDKWIVIDGLQRLSAFQNFLVGNEDSDGNCIKERLIGLEYMTDFNGFTFDELPRQYIRRIKETPIVAYTVEKGTPDTIVYNIFQRINTGGLELKPQEIRQALYVGKATELLRRMAENEIFLQATQYSIDSNRMSDCEYANRFVAFTELDITEYKGNVDDFLRKSLRKINQYSEEKIQRIEDSFVRVMTYCRDIFGKYAFRKFNENWRRGPINKALFESWSLVFSQMTDEELDLLVQKKQKLLECLQRKFQDDDYILALRAGDQYSVIRRIDITRGIVREVL